MPTPLLIALPHGLNVSGVTLWAVRLAEAISHRRRVGLLLHREPTGQNRLAVDLPESVRVFDRRDLPPIETTGGDLGAFLPAYEEAVRELNGNGPVIISPNLHGDCYGIAAAISQRHDIRIVGWQHSDNTYDARVLSHFQSIINRFVAVSRRIDGALRRAIPERARDIELIPYGVPVAKTLPPRSRTDSLRLVYVGRIEHEQKRALALPLLSRELDRRGIRHTLTIVGDGPAVGDLRRVARGLASVRLLDPADPSEVQAILREHDAFVLPSRYEGLSVAMLEALASGCVPIVSRGVSGVEETIIDGETGMIADIPATGDESIAAVALANAVERLLPRDLDRLSRQCWESARLHYSVDRHTDRVSALLDGVEHEPRRRWPTYRPAAFTAAAPDGSSGSVPAGAHGRLAAVLVRLAGRKVLVHGTGEHTRQLRSVFLGGPAAIVAFTDDDPGRHGGSLWGRPIVSPSAARETGATDVVISSWMHADAIWERRGVYERQGMHVHHLYRSIPTREAG